MSQLNKILRITLSTCIALTFYCGAFSQNSLVEPTCDQLLAKLKDYIFADLNYCTSDSDCIIANGICPLGPYFIVNRKSISLMDSILTIVQNNCSGCIYDLPILPLDIKLECRNNKAGPAVNYIKTANYFSFRCEQIAHLYSQEFIGKNMSNLNLPETMFWVINESDTTSIRSSDPWNLDRVKVIIDGTGTIESLDCDN